MRSFSVYFLILLCSTWHLQTFGQCPGKAVSTFDVNGVRARVYNSADRFWDLIGNPLYEIPAGSGQHTVFANGTWFGGVDAVGDLQVSAVTYRQDGSDFTVGPSRTTGNYSCGNVWAPSITISQLYPVLALQDGRVIMFDNNQYELYDPATGGSVTGTMLIARNQFNVVELPGNRVMIYGDRATSSSPVNELGEEFLDLNTLTSTVDTVLNLWHGHSNALRISNDSILFTGRMGTEIYRISTNTSVVKSNMASPRHYHDAVLLPNNKVLVGPGAFNLNSNTGVIGTFELYDLANDSWASINSVNVNRKIGTKLVKLSTGNVIVSGGASNLLEEYDYLNSSFIPVGALPSDMENHSAILLAGDRVGLIGLKVITQYPNFITYFPVSDNLIFDATTLSLSEGPTTGFSVTAVGLPTGNIFALQESNEFVELDGTTLERIGARWEKVWKLNRSEIDTFLADYAAGTINFSKYPDIETWPAHGDVSLGEDYYLAPFVDTDMDGVYDPLGDGDYPCITGDQMHFWIYNDDVAGFGNTTSSGGLGIQVKSSLYGFDCSKTPCPDPQLDYATFLTYEISNKSGQPLSDVYTSQWFDVDIGGFSDDAIGCDTLLDLAFAYNGDPSDTQYPGLSVPAFGTAVLESPGNIGMTGVMYYENDFTALGNPSTDDDYYNYMRSMWKDGTPLTYGGNGYQGSVPTKYIYSGDPGFCGGASVGWSEISANIPPWDRRYIQSVGPYNLAAGEEVRISYANLWALDSAGDHLSSVCSLKAVADSVQGWFNSQTACFNLVVNRPEPAAFSKELRIFPNPNNGKFYVESSQTATDGNRIEVYDLAGKLVFDKLIDGHNPQIEVDLRVLGAGTYIVKKVGNNGNEIGKVVKY